MGVSFFVLHKHPHPGQGPPGPAPSGHPPPGHKKRPPGNPGGKNRLEREVFKTGLSAELKGIGQKETA